LDDTDYAALRTEVMKHPGQRMMVHRVADLHFHGPDAPDRGLGRNLLIFQFGEWINVQPRGLFNGSIKALDEGLVEDIRSRLLPAPFLKTEQELAAGKGAARVTHWIDSVSSWTADDFDNLPVAPWARRVRGLAGEVEQGATVYESAANHALLRRLYDTDTAELLQTEGIRSLVEEAVDVSRLTGALHLSAVGRSPNKWLSSLPAGSSLLKIFEHTEQGWDVCSILGGN